MGKCLAQNQVEIPSVQCAACRVGEFFRLTGHILLFPSSVFHLFYFSNKSVSFWDGVGGAEVCFSSISSLSCIWNEAVFCYEACIFPQRLGFKWRQDPFGAWDSVSLWLITSVKPAELWKEWARTSCFYLSSSKSPPSLFPLPNTNTLHSSNLCKALPSWKNVRLNK